MGPELEITRCLTDEDYEQWRQVRIAVLPYERCPSVAEMRANDADDRLMLLAREHDAVLGSGLGGLSDSAATAFAAPRVVPQHRRRGVGSALLERLAQHAVDLGLPVLRGTCDDDGSLAFALGKGFAEVDHEVEQTMVLDAPVSPTEVPAGIEVVLESEHPGLWAAALEHLGREALADFAVDPPLDVDAERWATGWLADPTFLALADGEVVGCAGLHLDTDQPDRAENGLTAVRRDWRGRGLAIHLKLVALAWAADHDIRTVYTWTQDGNAAMRSLNDRLGYATTMRSSTVSRSLPLD